jgi:hypothetical protein
MNFRLLILPFLFLATNLFAAEKWNILVANWRDLSPKKDKNIGLIIKKSVAVQLQKNSDFRIWLSTNNNVFPENAKDVILQGRTNRSDYVVYGDYYYGDYYIQGNQLLVVVELYDVLDKKLKLRKYYTGTITSDIFDTIDAMSIELQERVKEVLPPMDAESEVRIKKLRETVYETEKVEMKRLFYTHIGFATDFGPRDVHLEMANQSYTTNRPVPVSLLTVGFTVRYWDFRLDFTFSGMAGIPTLDWNTISLAPQDNVSALTLFTLSYYLPWWDNQWAVGLGIKDMRIISKIYSNESGQIQYDSGNNPGGIPLTIDLIWNPNPNWEFSFAFMPMFYREYIWIDNDKISHTEKTYYNIPNTYVSAICLWETIGIELGLFYNWGRTVKESHDYYGNRTDNFMCIALNIAFVYKVDFMK